MDVEFLDPDVDGPDAPGGPKAVAERRRPHRRSWRSMACALVALVVVVVVGAVVVTRNGPRSTPRADPALDKIFAPTAPQRFAAETYERQLQCYGPASRALAAMPGAYRQARHASAAQREAAARDVLANLLDDGAGSRSYALIAQVWDENRAGLLAGRAGLLAEATEQACARIAG